MDNEIQQPYVELLGSRLQLTTYGEWIAFLQKQVFFPKPIAVDFVNTHILALRRMDAAYRQLSECMDYTVPDSMPLVWCMRLKGAQMEDRLYGPTFMRECLTATPAPLKHYFLGGREDCLQGLIKASREFQPQILIAGYHIGWFSKEEEDRIIDEINSLSPDFIWVGLGTPLQQRWIARNKHRIKRGIILAVGYAFDVNAGTKKDSPQWMQRNGLGWLFRLCSEPFRLGPRYLKYNSIFIGYLLYDSIRNWMGGKR